MGLPMVLEGALVKVMMLCRESGSPLTSLPFKTRVVHALFVSSYLLLFSLVIIIVAAVTYDKYG